MNIKKIVGKIMAVSLAGLLAVNMAPLVSMASKVTPVDVTITATVDVEVEKDSTKPDEATTFIVELAKENGDIVETLTTKGGVVEFKGLDELTYSSPGVHNYVITQKVKTKVDGYTYDTNSYNVKVSVVNMDGGKLEAVVTAKRVDSDSKSKIEFKNKFNSNPETPDTPETPNTPETPDTPEPDTPNNDTPSDTPSEPETPSQSETPKESETESTTESSTVPVTPNPPDSPSTQTPNRPDDTPPRDEVPDIPVIEELSNPEYVNLDPDPVPLVSLTTLDDDEVPKAVIIDDDDTPLAVLTGDTFNMLMWILLLAGSAAVIVLVIGMKIKDRKNNK